MKKEILFQNIFEQIEVPIFIIDVLPMDSEAQLTISNINPAFNKISGIRREKIIGKSPDEISQLIGTNSKHCQESGTVVNFNDTIRFPLGKKIFHVSLFPVPDEEGHIYCLIGVAQDITEKKRTEMELKRSHDLFQLIIDAAPTPILDLDLEGNVHSVWNRAAERMLGWKAEEVIGRPLPSIPANRQEEFKRLRQVLRQGKPLQGVEVVREKRDGSSIDYSIYASPLKDNDDKVIGNVAVLVDISARKRLDNIMNARLRLLELTSTKSKDELLTATLDEIETLTGSSIGFYHFLEADQKTLFLQNWSTNTLKNMCTAEGKNTHYDIDEAGVWTECVYKRSPVIHNDYEALPHKKGMPDGHTPVIREVVVPIFRGKQIKAIIGVGNKPTDYDESDVEIVSQLGDLSWDFIERKMSEEALKHSEWEKTIMNRIANIFLTIPDAALYREVLKVILKAMQSSMGIFGYLGENGNLVIPGIIQEYWKENQASDNPLIFPGDSLVEGLWERAIKEKKAFISDGPFQAHNGDIKIDYVLTAPILSGQKIIGLISVANKEGGYNENNKTLLERIADNISPILHARLQRDLEEKKRMTAELDLRESEEKHRLLFTNADEAIFIAQNEAIKFPNPKTLEMSGYSEEELMGISFDNLIHSEDKEYVLELFQDFAAAQRLPATHPFRIINKEGKLIWVQLTTAPINWENKPGILCFLKDITAEKKLEAQFMQSQKMEAVGRLAGGVAHDFNNMLVVIMGQTELILRKIPPSEPFHDQLKLVHKAALRSADLTRQLLAFARKQVITPKILNLNDVVSSMFNMLKRLIGEDIELSWNPDSELWPVKMDPSQVDQILANLCVNSRDAISSVGKISIKTENIKIDESFCLSHADFIPGEFVRLTISDNGSGMSEETIKHIFEPFFTTKGIRKGTGLGLATVYGIVKQNNGFINVYSEPGLGTTSNIFLPSYSGKGVKTQIKRDEEEPLKKGDETILIIEDDIEILELIKRILEELGYTVLTAKKPNEAINQVSEHTGKLHLIITDVVMPGMNGRELVKRLRIMRPSIKCLFMSGYTADIMLNRTILEKGVHFIQKPFSIKDISLKVREVLDKKSIGCKD